MVQGERLVSMSAWDAESNAKGADEAAKDWVSKNAADMKVVSSVLGDYAWLEFARPAVIPRPPLAVPRGGRAVGNLDLRGASEPALARLHVRGTAAHIRAADSDCPV
jgi:hypothetical protein